MTMTTTMRQKKKHISNKISNKIIMTKDVIKRFQNEQEKNGQNN